jgi:hypothetical protein
MEPIAALEQLGEQFSRLGEPAQRSVPRKVRVPRKTLVFAALLVLALGGVAAAAILISQGAPLPAAHVQDLRSSGVPLPGSVRLAGLDAPDPDSSAPPWDIRLSRTADGETCSAVGQVFDGQFGIVGLDHVFRALPLGGVDSCGVASPDGPVLAGARVFVGASPQEARTVVNGVAGEGARSVTAYGPEGARALRLGPDGSFVTVYRGYVEEVRPRVVVVTRDGHSHTVAFAASSAFETPDPEGGSPWQVSGEAQLSPGAYPDENCAQASRELGPADPSHFSAALTPEVCGRLGQQPLFVAMRRFVPPTKAEADFSGVVPQHDEALSFPWGPNPPRTLVYGAAAPRVASLTLTGDGSPRSLPIDPHGGVFLAVLDGHVDPRSLTLTARLRTGQTLTYTRSANLLSYYDNRPLPQTAVPAYREPLPESVTQPPPLQTPIASTVRQTLRAADPAGGPAWALRSWQGIPNPHLDGGRGIGAERFICTEVGVLHDGVLVEAGLDSSGRPLSTIKEYDVRTGGCTQPKYVDRSGHSLQIQSYVDDPFSYEPQPARTVVSGLLPAGASHAVLLGAGASRPLRLDRNDAFLAVLAGRYWDASLRVSYRLRGRTIGAGPAPRLAPGTTPQARAPDPDGGAPWGIASSRECSTAIGRIVEDRLAYVEELSGELIGGDGWTSFSSDCYRGPNGGSRQVAFQIVPVDASAALPGERAAALTPPQIERRTLPGRTLIAGTAKADVASITLATPRDVRTLVPSGASHAFIAAYDGQFFRGAITAVIHLRDGHDIAEALQDGTAADAPVEAPKPKALLRSIERQIAEVRAGRFAPAAHGGRRAPSRAAIEVERRRQVAAMETRARAIETRIAYERAHPGLLPVE